MDSACRPLHLWASPNRKCHEVEKTRLEMSTSGQSTCSTKLQPQAQPATLLVKGWQRLIRISAVRLNFRPRVLSKLFLVWGKTAVTRGSSRQLRRQCPRSAMQFLSRDQLPAPEMVGECVAL